MERIIKVGKMPGRIQELVVSQEMKISEVLEIAELDAEGYDIKADGEKVNMDDVANGYNTILLVKQVKGNQEKIVKVGKMPGRITELAVDSGMTVLDLLTLAELDAEGYDIKADGEKVSLDAEVNGFNTVLLVKQVKGNQ